MAERIAAPVYFPFRWEDAVASACECEGGDGRAVRVQRLGGSGDVLEGLWANDVLGGDGTLTTGRGDVYEGQFVDSLREGRGDCRFADGAVYTGGWAGGFYHGDGTLTPAVSTRNQAIFDTVMEGVAASVPSG